MILSMCRRCGFWCFDLLKGSPVRQAYRRIKYYDNLDCNSTQLTEYYQEAFANLRKEACDGTTYYKGMDHKPLSEFPIIDKNTIRSNQSAFLSSKYEQSKLYRMSTSGSTGTPFICYQNREKKRNVNAEIIYYSEKVGYKIGNNLSYIRTVVKQIKKSSLKQFLQNQTMINCGKLSDEGVKVLLSNLEQQAKHGAVTILGYGSTYTAIKDYIKKYNLECFDGKITGIISGSDMLFDETRTAMENFFGCKVVSRYSNEENGVIGQDEDRNNEFLINKANYIVEICDTEGNVLQEGSLGRIVVTDLYNYAMPMIRYDTGDIGAMKIVEHRGIKHQVLYNFSGRSVDVIYNTSGEALSPHMITNHLWSFPDISQFQLVQKGQKQFVLRLNVPDDYKRLDEVVEVFNSILGEDAKIEVYQVDEIPVLASGKRRYIINEWKS